MVIEKLNVKNFRSIEGETLTCSELTALVGRNGSGKSSFLRGLDLFYNQAPKVDTEDFYNGDVSREITIAITYKDLNPEATTLFEKYIQNQSVTVERVFSLKDGKVVSAYHGSALQNPEFEPVREALKLTDRGTSAKALYAGLKALAKYNTLPTATTKETIAAALKVWEAANEADCVRSRDDGKFFGFQSVGTGYLGRFTRFLFIPAIRDAAQDATDGPSSPITELMNLVVRSILAGKPELATLKNETQKAFKDLMDPSKLTELNGLAQDMTKTLKNFVPEASIEMLWKEIADIDFPLPKAETKLNQDGYASPVSRAGHGLQRAFIITALQHLVLAQQQNAASAEGVTSPTLPVLVLAIEEPELYQHPNSQHHLAKILFAIAQGKTPGVAEKTQVVYGTHSPHFVGIDRINQIRLLRKKTATATLPKVTCVVTTTLDQVAENVWLANGSVGAKFTGVTLAPRLQTIMTATMNEGFFADVAVLVEGEGDVAAIMGTADMMGHDLQSLGISVISCNSKNNIDRPASIFKGLGIATYVVWDSDTGKAGAKKELNHTMQRLVGKSPLVDFPPTQVGDTFACFEVKLEATLESELGAGDYATYIQAAQNKFGVTTRDQAWKMPAVISETLKIAKAAGKTSATLEGIVTKIMALKSSLS